MSMEDDPVERLPWEANSDRAAFDRSRPGSVLVVEDDDDQRCSLALAFASEGYEVAQAPDGPAAIDYLLRNRAPSVIVLDLVMPTLSGWDVLSLLRRYLRLHKVPVIVVSSQPATIQIPRASVIACMQKPIALEELLQLVRRCLRIHPRH